MATRSEMNLSNALIVTKVVKASSAATVGKCGKYDTDETKVLDCSAGDNPDVIFLETKTAGQSVQCVVLCGSAIVPVLVGTGAATAGEYATVVSDGVTNQTVGGGTTVVYLAGKFTQTGVLGDTVGLAVGQFASVKA